MDGQGGAIEEVFETTTPEIEVREVALGDMTGDGRFDVVLAGDGGVQVLENMAGRSLNVGATFTDIVPSTEVVDIDQDGDLDIIGQPPLADDEDFGSELLRNGAGGLAGPEPLFVVSERIVGLAAETDADGAVWLAAGTFAFRRTVKWLETNE